jgi:hypothetical protein
MRSEAALPPSDDEWPNLEYKGKRLDPMTVGVIIRALRYYQWRRPDFTREYFPSVMARGFGTIDDVYVMDYRQASALVPIMDESIKHFWIQDGRARTGDAEATRLHPLDPSCESSAAKKARIWTRVLRDICFVFDLPSPV